MLTHVKKVDLHTRARAHTSMYTTCMQYRYMHTTVVNMRSVAPETGVVRPSYLYIRNSFTGKTVHFYWDGPRGPWETECKMLLKWFLSYSRTQNTLYKPVNLSFSHVYKIDCHITSTYVDFLDYKIFVENCLFTLCFMRRFTLKR